MTQKIRKINYESMAPIVIPEHAIKSETHYKESYTNNLETPMTEDQLLMTLLASISKSGLLAYNNSTTLKLVGHLKIQELYRAITAVVKRHDSLRSTVSKDKTNLITHHSMCEEVHFFDFSNEKNKDNVLDSFFQAESLNAFDIEKSLFRTNIVKTSPQSHLLNITVHHIICDGVSIGIILQDIEAFYSAFVQGHSLQLTEPMQFSTFSNWRNSNETTPQMLKQEAYWLKKIQSLDAPVELPTDRPRPSLKTYNGARLSSEVDEELYKSLQTFSTKHKCTSFMTLFAAFNVLLHRVTGQKKFNVGIAFAGRTLPESEELVGYCSNIYPIQSHLDSDMAIDSYLVKLKNELLDAYDNQDYSFAKLISKAGNLSSDKSRSHFFSVAFNWDRVVVPEMHGLEVDFYPQPISAAGYDLMPNIMEVNGKLIFSWDYNTDLFDNSTIEEISKAYLNILIEILKNNVNPLEKGHMVPSQLLYLKHFPPSATGELDRKAVPIPNQVVVEKSQGPRNELEAQICSIWSEILDLAEDQIGIHDDFFQLGGNSILSVRLTSKLNASCQSSLKIADIFVARTIEMLAIKLSQTKTTYQPIVKLNNSNVPSTMFMIHPGTGGCEAYFSLANKLASSFSCFGVDSYNLYNEEKIYDLHQLATYYLKHIDQVLETTGQREYHLLGWSLGGQIALEIAAILEQRGYKQIKVYVLDTVLYDEHLISLSANVDTEYLKNEYRHYAKMQHFDESYINKVVTNIDVEGGFSKQFIYSKLVVTKVLLFKAMQEGVGMIEDAEKSFFRYIALLSYNNIEKIMFNQKNLKVINVVNANHLNILENEGLLSSEITNLNQLAS